MLFAYYTAMLRHQIETEIGIVPFIGSEGRTHHVLSDIPDNDPFFYEGAALVIQVKFNAQHLADFKIAFNVKFELKAGGRYVNDPHIAFVVVPVAHTVKVGAGQIRAFSVLPSFFQGDFEIVATTASAVYGYSFIDRSELFNIGRSDIATIRAYESGCIVAGDKYFFYHLLHP